jgi:hypothetical protein
LYHPANNLAFHTLPAYDLLSESPLQFGILHETLVTAGCILAYTKPGFLSTSRNRGARVEADLDSVIPVTKNYFHPEMPGTNPLYLICRDFKLWEFPHGQLPSSWSSPPSLSVFWNYSWDVQSVLISNRDQMCRISKWKESLSTAHVIPKTEETWLSRICCSSCTVGKLLVQLRRNKLEVCLSNDLPNYLHSRNFFALRYGLHLGQFDRGTSVTVPKCGRIVVQFIQRSGSGESAMVIPVQCFFRVGMPKIVI